MANTFTKIAAVMVGSGGASSIDFTSIPSTYTDLQILISARSDASSGSNAADISIRLNNDSGTNYSYRGLTGTGSTSGSFSLSGETQFTYIAFAGSSNVTSNTFGNSSVYFPNYAGATNKSLSADVVTENNATLTYMRLNAGLWANTAAINRMTLTIVSANFVQYSTATLYGIKNS
jgi:hypothetical protein